MTPFPPFRPRPEHRPTASPVRGAHVRLRWLGTAGHVIETGTTTLLIDPFLTRPSLLRTAFRRLVPAPDAWWPWLPARIDALLLGHSHFDHLLDAPAIALRTGARIVGSRTTASFARASGVPEAQIVEVPADGRTLRIGDCEVRFVPSLHGRVLAGKVPFPGEVSEPPHLPARLTGYRMGGAFGIWVRTPGPSIYHNGSADLVDAALDGLGADVLLAGLAGRQATPRYLVRLLNLLRPGLVVPTHHDAFFAPLEAGVRLLPRIDLGGFVADTRAAVPQAVIVTPTYDDVLALPADGADVRAATLYPR